MDAKLDKKSKKYYDVGLTLPLESLNQLEDLKKAGKDLGEIKRQGAIKEIEKMHKKFCS